MSLAALTQEEKDELCCVYAALILHDDNIQVTPDKINTLIEAAGTSVLPFYPELFSRVLASRQIDDLILTASTSGPAVAAAGPAPTGAAEASKEAAGEKKEEKKKEEAEEEEADLGGGGLFGDDDDY
ncbi:60S acidic ribosomal protein P1 [Balamuthia mandrillaris]